MKKPQAFHDHWPSNQVHLQACHLWADIYQGPMCSLPMRGHVGGQPCDSLGLDGFKEDCCLQVLCKMVSPAGKALLPMFVITDGQQSVLYCCYAYSRIPTPSTMTNATLHFEELVPCWDTLALLWTPITVAADSDDMTLACLTSCLGSPAGHFCQQHGSFAEDGGSGFVSITPGLAVVLYTAQLY